MHNFVEQNRHGTNSIKQSPTRRNVQIWNLQMERISTPQNFSLPQNQEDESTICAVCLFGPGSAVTTTTDCNHTFHKKCLEPWLEDNVTCPLCRAPLANRTIARQRLDTALINQAGGLSMEELHQALISAISPTIYGEDCVRQIRALGAQLSPADLHSALCSAIGIPLARAQQCEYEHESKLSTKL